MKLRLTILIFTLLTYSTSLWAQDRLEFERSKLRLQELFDSDSSVFHYTLGDFDSLLIYKMKMLNDTLPYFPYTTFEKPYKWDKTSKNHKKGKGLTTTKFMADNSENWRSGDHIGAEIRHLPTRIFLFGVTNADWTAIFYWHGGAAKHMHIVLTDSNFLTSFVAWDNDIVRQLHYAKGLKQIESYGLNDLLTIKDVYYLNNKLMDENGDIF